MEQNIRKSNLLEFLNDKSKFSEYKKRKEQQQIKGLSNLFIDVEMNEDCLRGAQNTIGLKAMWKSTVYREEGV